MIAVQSNSGAVGYCLTASAQQSLDAETETETMIAVSHALRGEGFDASENGTGRGTPIVPVAFGISNQPTPKFGVEVFPTLDAKASGGGRMEAVAIQERAVSENPNAAPDGVGVKQDGTSYTLEARKTPQPVAFDCKGTEVQFSVDGSHPTLRSMGHNHSHQNAGGHAAVAFDLNQITSPANRSRPDPAVHHTLPATTCPPHLATPWAVRRLTPRECERLQGFPDDATDVPNGNKPAADGPRYKAIGNSWAVNCADWIAERMTEVDAWTE